MEKNISFSNC